MTSETQALSPVGDARIASLDVLRGVAVLGILLMNIVGFGLLPAAYNNPEAAGGARGADLAAWFATTLLFEGTMRGLFSMLFGASIVLLTGRMAAAGAGLETAEIYFRRMMWMMLFGFVHWALLLWYGEILFAYSLCGLALFAVRNAAPRSQLRAAIALLVLSVGLNALDHAAAVDERAAAARVERVAPGQAAPADAALAEAWRERADEYAPPADERRETLELHRGGYVQAVAEQWPMSYAFQWETLPYWAIFDMIPFMLLGMALLRLDVLSAQRPARFYAAMAAAGYVIGLPLNAWEAYGEWSSGFAVLAHSRSGITYEISRLAMVFGHLGALLLIIRGGVLRRLQARLAAVGQMAFSNYIAQTMICTALFWGFGFGLFMQLARHELYAVVALIWAAELIWSPLWLRRFRFGPLEWLWRSLAYARRQPMRRAPPAPVAPGLA